MKDEKKEDRLVTTQHAMHGLQAQSLHINDCIHTMYDMINERPAQYDQRGNSSTTVRRL